MLFPILIKQHDQINTKLGDYVDKYLKNMSLRDPAYVGSWQSSRDRHVAYAPRDDN